MSADILNFDVFAGNGKGLMARPILPNDVIATKSLIDTIAYSIKKMSGGSPVTGSIDPLITMVDVPVKWKADSVGRTFLWPIPGTLIPTPNEEYRIIITFVTKPNAVPEAG